MWIFFPREYGWSTRVFHHPCSSLLGCQGSAYLYLCEQGMGAARAGKTCRGEKKSSAEKISGVEIEKAHHYNGTQVDLRLRLCKENSILKYSRKSGSHVCSGLSVWFSSSEYKSSSACQWSSMARQSQVSLLLTLLFFYISF